MFKVCVVKEFYVAHVDSLQRAAARLARDTLACCVTLMVAVDPGQHGDLVRGECHRGGDDVFGEGDRGVHIGVRVLLVPGSHGEVSGRRQCGAVVGLAVCAGTCGC